MRRGPAEAVGPCERQLEAIPCEPYVQAAGDVGTGKHADVCREKGPQERARHGRSIAEKRRRRWRPRRGAGAGFGGAQGSRCGRRRARRGCNRDGPDGARGRTVRGHRFGIDHERDDERRRVGETSARIGLQCAPAGLCARARFERDMPHLVVGHGCAHGERLGRCQLWRTSEQPLDLRSHFIPRRTSFGCVPLQPRSARCLGRGG